MRQKLATARNDIAGLAAHAAFQAQNYKEVRRAQQAQSAAAHWHLIAQVRHHKERPR